MCIHKHVAGEIFALVTWPEEDNAASVISNLRNNVTGPMCVGELCEVVQGRRRYPARVHATGTHCYVHVHLHCTMYVSKS